MATTTPSTTSSESCEPEVHEQRLAALRRAQHRAAVQAANAEAVLTEIGHEWPDERIAAALGMPVELLPRLIDGDPAKRLKLIQRAEDAQRRERWDEQRRRVLRRAKLRAWVAMRDQVRSRRRRETRAVRVVRPVVRRRGTGTRPTTRTTSSSTRRSATCGSSGGSSRDGPEPPPRPPGQRPRHLSVAAAKPRHVALVLSDYIARLAS
jgi:hypothetical protein